MQFVISFSWNYFSLNIFILIDHFLSQSDLPTLEVFPPYQLKWPDVWILAYALSP